MTKFPSAVVLSVALAAACCSLGCTTMDLTRLTEGGAFGTKPPQNAAVAPGSPMVAVEFHSASSKVQVVNVPLEEGMTVQDLVAKTKAGKHFRRVDIDLMRVHQQSGEPHKMTIAYDNGKDRVSHSTNYALYPNDRLKVVQNPDTALDDMVNAVMGTKKKKR